MLLLACAAGSRLGSEEDPIYRFDLHKSLREIIQSAIFELLNVFDIDITPEQTSKDPYLELLRDLYQESKGREIQLVEGAATESKSTNPEEDSYQYPSCRLISETDQIRLLEILPGNGADPIDCHLTVRNLNDDAIPEALSYVWGIDWSTVSILVN
ncbi:hypothetical protein F4677DRAFT_410941 [Hypoxylon crocopeplum]|nr:hypothetical protein F4677DRAFT_410941 [Hypoxylon crocopeplum]